MNRLEVIADAQALEAIAADWARLTAGVDFFYPGFEEVRLGMTNEPGRLCVMAVRDGGRQVRGIAVFANAEGRQGFTIGERKLWSLPVRRTTKVGFDCLGSMDEEDWRKVLEAAIERWPFTMLDLGEVPVGSPLHGAVRRLGARFATARSARKSSIRWFIDMPPSFEEFLAGLRPSTRKSVTYKMRRFERELNCDFVTVTDADEIDRFLREGEQISRKTYQWNVGQRLENDFETRAAYERMAARGAMRCYLLHVDGEPAGFLRGELQDGIYHYETPGFDPKLEKHSPGLVLLLWVIRDLIENAECRVFDFGVGGDNQGYKARFGNRSVECDPLQIFRTTDPYSMLVYSAQQGLSVTKNIASSVLGESRFRQKLKKMIRKYEVDPSQG